MLRKLVMAACCVALVGIGLATAETAGQPPNWLKSASRNAATAATSASANSGNASTTSRASHAASSVSATAALEAIGSRNASGAIGSAHEAQAQSSSGAQSAQATSPNATTADIPAHHETASKEPLPGTLDPTIFPDVINQNIYALAAKEKKVLYQQPCYCHCDHEVGHKSLLDCYVDRHASVCAVCKMEAVFAYQETKKGKTPAQIREEIIQGKWRTVDLTSYQTPGAVTPDTKPEK